jgi:hypothetical protein
VRVVKQFVSLLPPMKYAATGGMKTCETVPLAIEREFARKAKPVSLHPLTFDEALKQLINVDPDHVEASGWAKRDVNENDESAKNQKTTNCLSPTALQKISAD